MTLRNFSSTAIQTTLSGGITASATSVPVTATTGFPAAPFILVLEPGTANQEAVLVTVVAGLNLTVTRGYDSTTGVSHNAGAVVQHSHIGIDFREANAHVNANTGVHGLTGTVVGTSDIQTVTNKTISAASNTLSGIAASSFVLSNGSGNLDSAAGQKAIPAGTVVGTSDSQVLTNKTLTTPKIGSILDAVFAVVSVIIESVASGVNYVRLIGSATGNAVGIGAGGTDTNVAVNIFSKGSGAITLNGVAAVDVSSAQTLTNKTLTTPVIGGATLTKIQKGNGTCVFSAEAGPVSVAVTFGSAFSVAPEVTLGSQHATTIFWATSITTTGFTLNARQYDSTARSLSAVCSYTAMV